MELIDRSMLDKSSECHYFAGPLNVNRATRQVTTAMGAELILNECQFEILDMLATREDEILAYEQLYEAVWEGADGPDHHDVARDSLEDLIEQVKIGDWGMA